MNVAPCGTFTAYKRHKRNDEPVDEACAKAARDQKNVRAASSRDERSEVVRLSIVESDPVAEGIDELERLRWNLQILEATMSAGVPSGMAALSKQHADLVGAIHRLELREKPGVSVLDDIARRREERRAASSH